MCGYVFKKEVLVILYLSWMIIVQNKTYAQTLSLYNAIEYALHNNKTILYAAEQSHLTSQAQFNSVEAIYDPMINAQFSLSKSLSKTKYFTPATGEEFYQVDKYQQFYPNVNLQQTFLTPLGSKLTLTGGLQTVITGISSPSYQTLPTLGFQYQQPLSPSGIASGHSDKEQAQLSFQNDDIVYKLQKEQLIISVIQSYFQLWQAEREVTQSIRDKESAQSILEIAEIKLRHGSIAEFEVLNIRVQYNLAEDNLL